MNIVDRGIGIEALSPFLHERFVPDDASGAVRAEHRQGPQHGFGAPPADHRSAPRVEVDGDAPPLVREVADELNRLLALPRGWDSYGGRPPTTAAALAAMEWLFEASRPGLPTPLAVPGSDGSVQLEWHLPGLDLEVRFDRTGEGEFFMEDRQAAATDEASLIQGADRLRSHLAALTTRAGQRPNGQ